jgi:hypothetical protein
MEKNNYIPAGAKLALEEPHAIFAAEISLLGQFRFRRFPLLSGSRGEQ